MTCRYTLKLKCNDNMKNFYEQKLEKKKYEGDSGFDIYTPKDISFKCNETVMVHYDIQCVMFDNKKNIPVSYYLYPRSSIAKTPLILHNGTGIIDSGYRGNIIGALRFLSNNSTDTYDLKKDTAILQICSPSLKPFNVEIVSELDNTERGSNGFGSTN